MANYYLMKVYNSELIPTVQRKRITAKSSVHFQCLCCCCCLGSFYFGFYKRKSMPLVCVSLWVSYTLAIFPSVETREQWENTVISGWHRPWDAAFGWGVSVENCCILISYPPPPRVSWVQPKKLNKKKIMHRHESFPIRRFSPRWSLKDKRFSF